MDASASIARNIEPASYRIVLKNHPDELTTLVDWLKTLSSQLQLSSRDAFRLDIALAEAVTNIIAYAYEDEAEHDITVLLHDSETAAKIELIDDGRAFDPLQHPPAVLPNNLEEAREGGLGIHLIRSYVDECSYQRNGQQNVLTLVFHKSS